MREKHHRSPVLLSEGNLHCDWITRPLVESGFHVQSCPFDAVPERLAGGRYNVLVLGRFYQIRKTRQQDMAALQALTAGIRDFLARGGGVFFAFPSGGVLPVDGLLSPYGAGILDLNIEDPERLHEELDGSTRIAASYTTDVRPPVARDVRGVWYPTEYGAMLPTRPLRLSGREWTVVLRGSARSRTIAVTNTQEFSLIGRDQGDSGYRSSVPLMAVRNVGPGRLAVCGIPSGYLVDPPHNFPLAHKVLSAGFEGQPSDLLRLLINTLEWLAEPSRAAGTLGGAATERGMLSPQVPRYPEDPPVQWASRQPLPTPRPLRGLIGARSRFSTGRGTVRDYVRRARAAGLDFLVFLEDFKALDTAGFEALKTQCRALSTDSFFAVPGYTLEDCAGNHFFQYGYDINLPRADLLSPDGKVLMPRGTGGTMRNRHIGHVNNSLIFADMQQRGRRGLYLHNANPIRLTDLRAVDSIALVTWEDGAVLDDVRDAYRMLEAKRLRLSPAFLTFMNRPSDVDRAVAAGWRNLILDPYADMPDRVLRKHMAPELEWWGMLDEEQTRKPGYPFNNWQFRWPFQYATDGPEVQAWTLSVTGRDPGWRAPDSEVPPTADWFRADVAGFCLHLKVSSDAGLKEVRVFDGERCIRRWKVNGARTFEDRLDLVHHQQQHLMLEAEDVKGGRLMGADYATLRLDWCDFYCADRNNPLSIGFQKDPRGFAHGWSGTIYLTYNNGPWGGVSPTIGRWWYCGDRIYPVPRDPLHDVIIPSDGGIRPSGSGIHVFPLLPPLEPAERGFMLEPLPELTSTDVAIGGFLMDHGFDPEWPYFYGEERTGWSLFPSFPTRYLRVRRNAVAFRPRPGGLTALVYEYRLEFKRNPHLTEPLKIGWADGHAVHCLHTCDGRVQELPGTDDVPWLGKWRHGEALVSWTEGRQPAIFINDGVDLELCRDTTSDPVRIGPTDPQRGLLALQIPVHQLPPPQGATHLRFIAIGGDHGVRDRNVLQRVRRAMGLAGEPGYEVAMQAGKILSQRLILDIDGERQGAAFRIPRTPLPMSLPVTVRNLNANWPAFLVDRERRRWRPLGMLKDRAYAVLDTAACAWSVLIGHPVTASDPRIVLQLAQISKQRWSLEVHNPTDEPLTVQVQPSPFFRLVRWTGKGFRLQPGSSRRVTLPAECGTRNGSVPVSPG